MENFTVTVIERAEGWYVTMTTPVGPFLSKAMAMNLANGMAASLTKTGHHVRIVVTSKAEAA